MSSPSKPKAARTWACAFGAESGFSASAPNAVCSSPALARRELRTVLRPSLASASHPLRSSITLPWNDSFTESVVK
ncbi:hypothetical protein [Nocardia rosealba]|uniref:hypothetical protein n=1 Tax=Nocardia rosealba TaxID=2878563 RepID=UPI001CD9250D|nr:hypothetical protein [Nocardia rosealba]MCA2210576.1 hypothetical protein [Nocardia rosealba]